MESLGKYLLSIVIAAAICGIMNGLVSGKQASGSIIRLISGIFMAITVITPLVKIEFDDFESYVDAINTDAQNSSEMGVSAAEIETAKIIKQQLEAYILDKAEALHLSVSVELVMTEDFPPSPYAVQISGSVSPYNKKVLSEYISSELSIPEERQTWK